MLELSHRYSSDIFQFSLANFEGSIEQLLHLVQKGKMDVFAISLKKIISIFLEAPDPHIDRRSDFLSCMSILLLWKSKKLLPQDERASEAEELGFESNLIQQLMEYQQFKEIAIALGEREEEQQAFFPRGFPEVIKKMSSGLEEVHLHELKLLFEMIVQNQSKRGLVIKDESWKVEDKIEEIRKQLADHETLSFFDVFKETLSREERAVLFIALLEMMKNQEAAVKPFQSHWMITHAENRRSNSIS